MIIIIIIIIIIAIDIEYCSIMSCFKSWSLELKEIDKHIFTIPMFILAGLFCKFPNLFSWEGVNYLRVQYQVKSYQRLKKWYLMPPCLTLHYKVRIKGKVENPLNNPWRLICHEKRNQTKLFLHLIFLKEKSTTATTTNNNNNTIIIHV